MIIASAALFSFLLQSPETAQSQMSQRDLVSETKDSNEMFEETLHNHPPPASLP